jgi:hypothetical protein
MQTITTIGLDIAKSDAAGLCEALRQAAEE